MGVIMRCPYCSYENTTLTHEWEYGPKRRGGVHFIVKQYRCPNCDGRFREYINKKTLKVTISVTRKRRQG
jgi:transcriptional regulator NrdR family protein